MSSFKMQGTIKMVGQKVNVSEKFAKREIVLVDDSDMYPQDIMFQFTQDKCDLLSGLNAGQKVELSFNLKGREWTSPAGEVKYFNTLEGWKIDVIGGGSASPTATATTSTAKADDDLPF